jgi:pumilio homology domain family member 6
MDEAKRIWASARQKDTPRAEREKLCKDLAGVVKGKVTEVVFKHDASRMIQTVSINCLPPLQLIP